MTPFEAKLRRHIAQAEADAESFGPGLSRARQMDAEALRRILRAWTAATTPEGRVAASLGLPTGPVDGGFA